MCDGCMHIIESKYIERKECRKKEYKRDRVRNTLVNICKDCLKDAYSCKLNNKKSEWNSS